MGGWGESQLERSAHLTDSWLPGVVVDNAGVAARKATQRKNVAEAGGDWDPTPHSLMRDTVIADTHERAVELGEQYLYRSYVDEYGGEFGHPFDDAEPRDLETLAQDRFLVGTPSGVASQIDDLWERFPLDHLVPRFHHFGMPGERVREQMELFGDGVLPQV